VILRAHTFADSICNQANPFPDTFRKARLYRYNSRAVGIEIANEHDNPRSLRLAAALSLRGNLFAATLPPSPPPSKSLNDPAMVARGPLRHVHTIGDSPHVPPASGKANRIGRLGEWIMTAQIPVAETAASPASTNPSSSCDDGCGRRQVAERSTLSITSNQTTTASPVTPPVTSTISQTDAIPTAISAGRSCIPRPAGSRHQALLLRLLPTRRSGTSRRNGTTTCDWPDERKKLHALPRPQPPPPLRPGPPQFAGAAHQSNFTHRSLIWVDRRTAARVTNDEPGTGGPCSTLQTRPRLHRSRTHRYTCGAIIRLRQPIASPRQTGLGNPINA